MKTILILSACIYISGLPFKADCDYIYNKLDRMSVESSQERLELENQYFEACQK